MASIFKAIWIFSGAATGGFLFLLCASLWLGSPVQDLVMSSQGHLLNHTSQKLSPDEIKNLNHLIELNAVMPAEMIMQRIVEFYTSLITVLIGLLAIFGMIAYMYIRASSREEVHLQTENFLRSDGFKDRVSTELKKNFDSTLEMFTRDYSDGLEALDTQAKRIRDIERQLKTIENTLSERDAEESGGESLNISAENGG